MPLQTVIEDSVGAPCGVAYGDLVRGGEGRVRRARFREWFGGHPLDGVEEFTLTPS
ncbi:hypothetical protein ACFY12_25145 [Streptomyces sp. NPDC001339]|uniref:hypothetical protein n=1 Tax=Streptomyces sp. NPDC001339 TaxID=3364563 RepID=UPI003699B5AC